MGFALPQLLPVARWALTPPFHPYPLTHGEWAVCSLWHFPEGHPYRVLPGILPCGARTFLSAEAERSPGQLEHCSHSRQLSGVRASRNDCAFYSTGPRIRLPCRSEVLRSALVQSESLPAIGGLTAVCRGNCSDFRALICLPDAKNACLYARRQAFWVEAAARLGRWLLVLEQQTSRFLF